jgi:hypothetical protein
MLIAISRKDMDKDMDGEGLPMLAVVNRKPTVGVALLDCQ